MLNIFQDYQSYRLNQRISRLQTGLICRTLKLNHVLLAKAISWLFIDKVKATPTPMLANDTKRYVIVANHYSRLDGHLLMASLRYDTYVSLLPIRFFIANQYMRRWWQKAYLLPSGGILAFSMTDKLSGMRGGLQLSDQGHTLSIFPEGKRVKDRPATVRLKPGIGWLGGRRNLTYLPAYIEHHSEWPAKRVSITWGEPFQLNTRQRQKTADEITEAIFRKVERLHPR